MGNDAVARQGGRRVAAKEVVVRLTLRRKKWRRGDEVDVVVDVVVEDRDSGGAR